MTAVEGSTVHEPIEVVAIAGTGQNGATLASRLMGELQGWVAVGEVARLWDKGLLENVDCSCGKPFRSCPFWTEVGEAAFGGWDGADVERGRELVDALMLRSSPLPQPFALPSIAFPRLSRRHARTVDAYVELTRRLFAGILQVSGARVIIDSSKWPAHVYALGRSRSLRTRVVHLVRDARGVAYSNTKQVARQGSRADRPFRVRQRPWKLAVRWSWINLSFHVVRLLGVPVLRVRYESLASDPRGELARIARFGGVEDPNLDHIHDAQADLPSGHLVAGNRMRLAHGPVHIRPDDEWRASLTASDRRLVTMLTWPLLRIYGYARPGRTGVDR